MASVLYKGGDKIPVKKKEEVTETAVVNKPTTPAAGTYEYNGETKQGYIKDGKTYTDANYTTEVPVGSKVYTNGGTFIKSGGGGLKMDTTPISANPAPTNSGNGATPVRYTVNGQVNTGYLKDGRTYTDANLTTRVPYGAVVQTNGGTYQMTANEGAPTAQTQINTYNNDVAKYMDVYKAAEEAQKKQIDANVSAAIGRLSAQKADIDQQKREADRVAYNAYLRATNPYGANAQQVAKLGLGGSGFSETNLTSLGNQYQDSVNKALLERDRALRDINLQIEEARLSGDMQKAQAISAYAQNMANMGMSAAQISASLAQSAANAAYAQERDRILDERYADQLAYTQEQDLFSRYLQLINAGLVPSDAAKVLNLSQAQLDSLIAYNNYLRNKRSGTYIGSGGGGGGTGGGDNGKKYASVSWDGVDDQLARSN